MPTVYISDFTLIDPPSEWRTMSRLTDSNMHMQYKGGVGHYAIQTNVIKNWRDRYGGWEQQGCNSVEWFRGRQLIYLVLPDHISELEILYLVNLYLELLNAAEFVVRILHCFATSK